MKHRSATVAFGLVAVAGLVMVVIALVGPFEPITTEGNETGSAYVAPLRQVGGALVIAAIVGWLVTRFSNPD